MLLKGATVADVEPSQVERADLRIDGGLIVDRATSLEPQPGDEVINLGGKLLFPGFVSAQHHLHATLLRGFPRRAPGYEGELLARHALEDALTGDELEAAATAGALEGLLAGTTTVFDVTLAGHEVTGSLSRVAKAINHTGLRAVLACEVTERAGPALREEALHECTGYAKRARGRYRGAIALGSLGDFSDEALGAVKELRGELLLAARLAEDPREEAQSKARFGATAAERLVAHEFAGRRTVLSHGVHLSWPELSSLISQGTWLVHDARSNMASRTGHATVAKFGVHGCFGTDTYVLDLFAEAQAACLRTADSGQPIDVLRFIANGHRLASEAFGVTIGPLTPGAVADLVVLDYHPPTPLDASSLAAQVLNGLSARAVESVMVDGLWRLWKHKALALDVAEVARHAQDAAKSVWARMQPAG